MSRRFLIASHKKDSSPGAKKQIAILSFYFKKLIYWSKLRLNANSLYVPITDINVDTAVSVASTASSKTFGEHDANDVMENPTGL